MNTTQKVAEIRKQLKAQFPDFKFSVRKRDCNSMSVYILSAPYKMIEEGYQQVNEYYIDSHYEGRTKEDLLKIKDIVMKDVTYYETGDYGTQPNFYTWISIGQWDKHFEVK